MKTKPGRRSFLKSGVKVLPALAVLGLAPAIAGQRVMNCQACSDGCFNTCKDTCTGECSGNCKGDCTGSCKGDCSGGSK